MNSSHPFNIIRYCPLCGSHDFKKACERSLHCHKCGFTLFINAAAAVAALIDDGKGKLLLTTRGVDPGYGMLDLPGGFINPGETAEDAVKRELHEELGIKVKSLKYINSAPNEYLFKGLTVFTLDMAFQVVPYSFENLKPMDDIKDFGFYSEEEINYDLISAPSVKNFVKQYFRT